MTFEVQLIDLSRARVLPDESDEELPLASLRSADDHVHGAVRVRVDGTQVPHIDFFGPEDVCIGDWVHELAEARRMLLGTEASVYVFDECEQGQPAFRFQRVGDRVEVSIVASASGAAGDLEWGTHSCVISDFDDGISSFLSQLSTEFERASPGVGRRWVEHQQTSCQPGVATDERVGRFAPSRIRR
jgi:hypothetical protein